MFLKQFFTVALFLTAISVSAQKYTHTENVTVSKKYKSDTYSSTQFFAENIQNSTSFSVLDAILKNEALRSIIENQEMVTIFAPLDAGFSAMTDEEKEIFMADTALQSQLLKMHTVPGRIDSKSLQTAIEQNNGSAQIKTLAGTELNASINKKGEIFISDAEGNKAQVVKTDFYHKNGFFHIVEGVAAPLKSEE